MLRSIYRRISDALRKNGRKSARRTQVRRLTIESLESRKLLAAASLTAGSISDGSFEAPALAAQTFLTAPPSSPWQFSGSSGVSRNNSAFTSGNAVAPNGLQVGFLQNNSSISQNVYLEAGVYNLSFLAAQRVNFQNQQQEIEVLIDNAEVGLILPASTSYSPYQTSNFTIAATGEHSVELLGMSPQTADSTAFIDEVSIAPVVDAVLDGGFEQPAFPVNSFVTDPAAMPWQFTGTAGVASNGNSTEAQDAPAGTQVGFLQGDGSMSQTVYLDAGTYQLSMLAAQNTTDQSSDEEITVLVDGAQYGTISPTGTQYASYQSTTFSVAAGPHTIELLGVALLEGNNTAFLDQVSIAPASALSDGSFETPALNAGTYQFAPTGSSWQFSGGGGIAANGSTYTSGNPIAPDGSQVAILQGNGAMNQSVNLLAGSYDISFDAAQCSTNAKNQQQQIEILVDGAEVGLITPIGTKYRVYETSNFLVTPQQAASPVTVEFIGTNPQGGSNTALVDLVSLAASEDTITNGSFETPALGANTYQAAPSGTGWQFSGIAGVTTNGSAITSASANAPQGAQAAYVTNGGSLTYSVYLDAGVYTLSMQAAQRISNQSQNQQIEILVDGAAIGSITPSNATYKSYEAPNFSVAAGMHAIELLSTDPSQGKSTALIDNVSLAPAEDSFGDGGFETPVLAANTYQVDPVGSAWQFSGSAGVTRNGTSLTKVAKGSFTAADGAQVAFIENSGSISQSVYFDAGTYNISMLASQRVGYAPQQIQVSVGGMTVGLITPLVSVGRNSPASAPKYLYTSCQTSNFTIATAGTYNVEFLGMTPTAGSTAFIDDAAIAAGSAIDDGSFEAPVLAAKTYEVAPSGFGWQFSGSAGVSANNSKLTAGNPYAPVGTQVAFITQTGSMSESIDMAAGTYNLSFLAAQRKNIQANYESIEILVDGQEVGTATPYGAAYGSYATNDFTVTAGPHTIEFLGVDPSGGNNTALLDDVQLNV